MANQQVHIYDSYKREVERNNVEPIVSAKGEMQIDLDGEAWTESRTMTARWGDQEYGRVRVYTSNLGRVMEVQSLNRGWDHQIAIHRNSDDYWNYGRAMGLYHYLNG